MKTPVTREKYDALEKSVADLKALKEKQFRLLDEMLLVGAYELLWPGWTALKTEDGRIGLVRGRLYPTPPPNDAPADWRIRRHVRSYRLEMHAGDTTRRFDMEEVPAALRTQMLDRETEALRRDSCLSRMSEIRALRKEKAW